MKSNDRLPSLENLQAKIDGIKKIESESPPPKNNDMSQAMRLIIDLMAGVIMGTGCGYLLDKWLNTLPFFMIAGIFLGMAAGVKNMLRSAELMDKQLDEKQKDDK